MHTDVVTLGDMSTGVYQPQVHYKPVRQNTTSVQITGGQRICIHAHVHYASPNKHAPSCVTITLGFPITLTNPMTDMPTLRNYSQGDFVCERAFAQPTKSGHKI